MCHVMLRKEKQKNKKERDQLKSRENKSPNKSEVGEVDGGDENVKEYFQCKAEFVCSYQILA